MAAEPLSILITDDDREFRETLGGVLEPLGLRTLLAGDGQEALDIVHRDEVHLMLLDNNMPKLSGVETLLRVRQFSSELPCILMSARLDEAICEQARGADVFSILSKPVSCREVTSSVSLALERTYGWR